MLWLKSVAIEGFGPYLTNTIFTFPDEPGVVIVHGNNGRGKTSLLNAIYYAFFGEVRDQDLRPRPFALASNRDLAQVGTYGFEVTLTFTYEDDEYELTRKAAPKPGVATPVTDDDFTNRAYLARNGDTLTPDEAAHILSLVLPKDVARFFLFDGELLSEYEQLLHDESKAGRELSPAIEKILGVPVLQRARDDLATLADGAGRAVEREAAKNARTAQKAEALRLKRIARDTRVRDRDRKQAELDEYKGRLETVEGYMRAHGRYAALLRQRDDAVRRRGEAKAAETILGDDLRRVMTDAWRTVLAPTVRAERRRLAGRMDDVLADLALRLRLDAIETCTCGTCRQAVPEDVRAALDASIPADSPARRAEAAIAVGAFTASRGLAEFADTNVRPSVEDIVRRLDASQRTQVTLGYEIRELDEDLAEVDEEALREHTATRVDLLVKIEQAEAAIADENAKIAKDNTDIERMTREVDTARDSPVAAFRRRAALLSAASKVYDASVERFKTDLRARVETTASDLFLRMTTEPDYVALSINEKYGLAIRHRDGGIEEGRSAANAQMVALALMGALQANSPLRGPIIMDTPLARLDPDHTANVTRTLPEMSPQVILFVQAGELTRERAHEILGDEQIVCEYDLRRISAHETAVDGGPRA